MKKIIYSILTLSLGLVLSSGSCSPDAIDPDGVLINGIVWARYNVDTPGTFAATPESPGMVYQWNRKTGWSLNDPLTPIPSGKTWETTKSPATVWDAINDPCPTGWRVPSKADFDKLVAANNTWNNVAKGRLFFGSGVEQIFLPAAGRRSFVSNLQSVGTYGFYWAKEESSASSAYFLTFDSSSKANFSSGNDKCAAQSVRCVKTK
ncbi:MAG: hypothetical protein LBC84_03295 [Prevotellaceae bacterium]|jgi:uncharacterized protein (TIGR02145 family)|nr:hypothetical protein [Prevotellaceae bacterium]